MLRTRISRALFRIWQFILFYFRAKTLYGVHSPFVFDFVRQTLDKRGRVGAARLIENERRRLLQNRRPVEHIDLGTGKNRLTTNRSIVGNAASGPYKGKLLYRIAKWWSPESVLELGTALGIGTAYLTKGAGRTVTSLEGCGNCADSARGVLSRLDMDSDIRVGGFDDLIPSLQGNYDLVFIDGNHTSEALLRYTATLRKAGMDRILIILDDIYWSADMKDAWNVLCRDAAFQLSIDCFTFGLLIWQPDILVKQHFEVLPYRWKPFAAF